MAPTLNQRPQGKGLKLFKVLALVGFMIDIITVGAIFIVLGHDVGGPLECTLTNGNCNNLPGRGDQITFDSAVLANATLNVASLTSPTLTMTNTEEIMIASLGQGGFVTSIKDTVGDSYTQNLIKTVGAFPQNILEIWSTFYSGATGTTNALTVNWNTTASMMFFAVTYKNAIGIGNATGASGAGPTISFNIETEKSGSAIFGASSLPGIGAGTVPACASLKPIPGTGLVQRIAGCSLLEAGSPPGFAVKIGRAHV